MQTPAHRTDRIHQDVWVGSFILLFCGICFSLSLGKPGDSMTFPIILLSLMAAMAVPILWSGVRKTQAATAGGKAIDNEIRSDKLKVPFVAYLYIAAYVFLFWLAGYFVATAAFLPAMMLRFRLRKPLTIELVTLGYIVVIYALFVKQLNVPVLHFGYIERLLNF